MSDAQEKVQDSFATLDEIVANEQQNYLARGDVSDTIINIARFMTDILGILALAAVIWGGIQYLTAAGNETQIAKAKKTIFWAVIGLLVVGFALLILQLVQSFFP